MLNKAVPHQVHHHRDLIQTRTQTQVHQIQKKVPRKRKRARIVKNCRKRKAVKRALSGNGREEEMILLRHKK